MKRKIKSALISVYHKDGIEQIAKSLDSLGVEIYSTGGTQKFIEDLGINAVKLEDLTGYPSIFNGRVKSLHPKIFGGILSVRDNEEHKNESEQYEIPELDLIIVDLYPFEETVKKNLSESEIIEQIDIGGISLIRAAAKNYKDVLVVADRSQYTKLYSVLEEHQGYTNSEIRKEFAKKAFAVSSAYDSAIFNWFDDYQYSYLRIAKDHREKLRYGENPHQKAFYFGNNKDVFTQLHGKQLSYNNLLDVDAAINLISEFEETSLGILKHNNACGMASDKSLVNAWKSALAADPVSAFGGIIVSNSIINNDTALEINKLFFEIIIAEDYTDDAFEILSQKQNRIILKLKTTKTPDFLVRSNLNGFLVQEKDCKTETEKDLNSVCERKPDEREISDLIFANKLVKHTKSNAIVLVKDNMLLGGGMGQTSRVDALQQAIHKAKSFGLSLEGAVMASDAFFPFKDCVEIANKAGITAVIQPGGSIRDQESIDFCNANNMAMVLTGNRHFKH